MADWTTKRRWIGGTPVETTFRQGLLESITLWGYDGPVTLDKNELERFYLYLGGLLAEEAK